MRDCWYVFLVCRCWVTLAHSGVVFFVTVRHLQLLYSAVFFAIVLRHPRYAEPGVAE